MADQAASSAVDGESLGLGQEIISWLGAATGGQDDEHHYQSRRKPLPHLPTPPDLGRRPKKEPNISSYDGVTEYLAVLYNHYREDFLSEMRNAITSFRCFFDKESDWSSDELESDSSGDEATEETPTNFLNSPIRSGTIYQVLHINDVCEPHTITISMRGFNRLTDDKFWARSELLKPGSLVALSTDNFKSFTYILIKDDFRESGRLDRAGRTSGQLVRHPQRRETRNLEIELYPKCSFDVLKSGNPICAIEARSYFEAHRYVLDRIQDFQAKAHLMPLQQCIVELSTEVQRPAYLSKTKLNFSRKDELKLNKSQKSAMEYVLDHEVALIQGAPGTGKTFVGVNLVKFFSGMNEKIVIMAFTNHAVDHFILECERHGVRMDHLVRLGRQYCDAVHKYSLEARRDHWSCGSRAVIQKANIFTMTTSGACKFQSLVEIGEPKIVMVEEAAHITEAHLIAGLPASCQHLILIGDYFQLRPGVSSAARNYYLDLSLYERLIKGRLVEGFESRPGLQTVNLTPQYRMHPELAKVLVPNIYQTLDTDVSCTNYPAVTGLPMRVVFFQHDNKVTAPDKRETQSKTNKFEVEFLTRLCQYLLQNGHKEASITILSTNREQSKAIHDKLVSLNIAATWDTRRDDQAEGKVVHKEHQKGIRVTTVDGFQGEQNDILLVSFVSTSSSSLVPTRKVTTALSSARHGFYALGNFEDYVDNARIQLEMREKNSELRRSRKNAKNREDPFGRCPDLGLKLWRELHEHWSDPENWESAEDGILLPYLPIQCPRDGRISKIFKAADFDKLAPAGGCTYRCQTRFCSHYDCDRVCHPGDDHTSQCTQTVTVIYPGKKRETMTCQQLRKHRSRGGERVELTFLGCSHVKKVSLDEARSGKITKCEARETHKLKCGHSVTGKCGQTLPSCQQYIIAQLPCGHEGPTVVCGELTGEKLADLTAECPAKAVVELPCGHRMTKTCSADVPSENCNECPL